MDVSVIMINYNTFQLTKDALKSIFEYTKDLQYEVILVDNCSPDGSGGQLRNLFGDKIKYIQSGGNLGTSKAFNMGLKTASGRYILWLNTDILIKDNFIKKLFDYMESDPDCGMCGGNLYNGQGKPALSYDRVLLSGRRARRDVRLYSVILRRIFKRVLSLNFNYSGKPMVVGGIIGADFMVRRDCFEKVGAFDEDIFMYGEETEFTYRVHKYTDYKSVSVPAAEMIHFEGGGAPSENEVYNEKKERIVITGISTCLKKCYGEKDVHLYLKARLVSAKRRRRFCTFLRKRDRIEIFNSKIKLIEDYIRNFDKFYNAL